MPQRKHILSLLFLSLLGLTSEAQQQFAYRISFTDKAGAPPLSDPLMFLSRRALNRRAAQGITLDESDRPVSPVYVDSVLSLTGGILHTTSRWLNNCVVLLQSHSDTLSLTGKTFVADIQYIAYYQNGLHLPAVPVNDNGASPSVTTEAKTTADPGYYGASWQQTSLVKGECLHDQGFKGQGKLIAVIDDGFNSVNTGPAFDSTYTQGRILDTRNFVLDIQNVYGYSSHGTQVLSTIAGNMPGVYVGAAPAASYALYITEDLTGERPIEMDNFLAATERADSIGADVISSSLGYNWFDAPFADLTHADIDGKTTVAAQAVNIATQKGIVCVISAGNEGGNTWNKILTPGDADSALTIGSVDNNKVIAPNSGWGPNTAGHVKPNVCAQGHPASIMSSGQYPGAVNGTSMATPQIAGYAACMLQAYPSRTPYQLRIAIERSGHLYPIADNHAGYGVPNLCSAFQILNVPAANETISNVTISPNPFNDQLLISFSSKAHEKGMVAISDITGKLVHEQGIQASIGNNSVTLHLSSHITPGIYIGRLILNGQTTEFKLVKE